MASIITATNSSGLTTSADNSGVLQLASGTGNLVTVPSVTGTAMVSGNMPAFSAYQINATTTSVPTSTFTKITLDAEEFDTANCFASSRFTPNVAGYYQINGNIQFNSSSNIYNGLISIFKNGSRYKDGNYSSLSTASSFHTVGCLIYFNGSTDYIELYGFQNSGITITSNGGQSYSYLTGSLVRTA